VRAYRLFALNWGVSRREVSGNPNLGRNLVTARARDSCLPIIGASGHAPSHCASRILGFVQGHRACLRRAAAVAPSGLARSPSASSPSAKWILGIIQKACAWVLDDH